MNKTDQDRFSFRSIEVFIAVTEERSVTGAAKRFGCSASTVSNQLANLETSLGVQLIQRSAQRFQLTAAGELFMPRAQSILDEVMVARSDLSSEGYTPKMHLRIAVIEDFDRAVLPTWLKSVREVFPQCTFEIRSGTSHEGHAALFSRGVDMIVAADSTTFIEGVEEYQILTEPYLLVAPSSLGQVKSMQDLTSRPFVRYSREQLLAQQIEAHLRRSRIEPPREFECSSTPAVLSLVEAFDGWAITTPSAYIGAFSDEGQQLSNLTGYELPLPNFSRTISLYCKSGTLGGMPEKMAELLKVSMHDILVPQVLKNLPALNDKIEIIEYSNK